MSENIKEITILGKEIWHLPISKKERHRSETNEWINSGLELRINVCFDFVVEKWSKYLCICLRPKQWYMELCLVGRIWSGVLKFDLKFHEKISRLLYQLNFNIESWIIESMFASFRLKIIHGVQKVSFPQSWPKPWGKKWEKVIFSTFYCSLNIS